MGGFRTIDGVAERKPLARCNMEEVAAYQRAIEHRGPSGGVLFARTEDREQKEEARKLILRLCGGIEWPGRLTILTMPGLDWMFERQLLGYRETKWTTAMEHPARTHIYSVEVDRAIYFGAIDKMPGRLTRNAVLSVKKPPYFAEHSVKTFFIKRFYLANVDHLMQEALRDLDPLHFDVAWLDYTGPLSIERVKLIAAFFKRCVDFTLIVTALKARWNRETSDAIERAGGHSQWLREHLPGEVLHDIEYQDTVPMEQYAIRKINWTSPLC
jgi:hypothetical protein